MFDAFLLQQGATSMLDARDAMIAADQMRFGGANKEAMWDAFARRGMGKDATVANADDDQPTPSFASPTGPSSTVTFATTGTAKIYVGDYEARVTPVADTDPTHRARRRRAVHARHATTWSPSRPTAASRAGR